MHWSLQLYEFDFDVEYRQGTENYAADILSRLRTTAETTAQEDVAEIPALYADSDPPKRWNDELGYLNDALHDEMLINTMVTPDPDMEPVTPIIIHEK